MKKILFILPVLLLISCDKDFNEIGSNIIGDDHFDLVPDATASIVANNVSTGAVQSNNLDINPLGIYTDPVFGKTTANFVTQLELGTVNPTFTVINTPIEIESVRLSIPYYSRLISTDSDGIKIYELDSVYGAGVSKIKLNVYRNRYFLQNIDHEPDGTQQQQRYYTDQDAEVNAALQPGDLLNDSSEDNQNEQFNFSDVESQETYFNSQDESVTNKLAPGMYLDLNEQKFQDWIVNAPAGNLQNNNVFKNYFRGLYFKVEDVAGNPGQLSMLNFKAGKITIRYIEDNEVCTTNTDGTENCVVNRARRSLVLNMTGNTISLLNNTSVPDSYTTALSQPASALGVEKLYVKGGQGSLATIDLFGADTNDDEIPEQLQVLRDSIEQRHWLINEASLTFYATSEMNGVAADHQPLRLYLYDIKNKKPIIDYLFDNSNGADERSRKVIHSGIRGKDANGNTFYKIRLTNYLRDLTKDSTNVKLGLSVSKTINYATMAKLRTINPILNDYIPTASVFHQLGTVLYGNNIPVGHPDYEKRLKLEIYYTKPN